MHGGRVAGVTTAFSQYSTDHTGYLGEVTLGTLGYSVLSPWLPGAQSCYDRGCTFGPRIFLIQILLRLVAAQEHVQDISVFQNHSGYP